MLSPSIFDPDRFYVTYVKNPSAGLVSEWDAHAKEHALQYMKVFAFSEWEGLAIQHAKLHLKRNPSDWVFVVTPNSKDGASWKFVYGSFPNALVKKIDGEKVFSLDRFLSRTKENGSIPSVRFIVDGEEVLVTRVPKKFKYKITRVVGGKTESEGETNDFDVAFRIANNAWQLMRKNCAGKSGSSYHVKISNMENNQILFYRQLNEEDAPHPVQSEIDLNDGR